MDQLRTAHDTDVKRSGKGGAASGSGDGHREFVDHPLVLTHPETGSKGLYLTSRITHILDVAPTESEALLAFLRHHASGVNYQYRNHWNAGDLVVWDNRSVWHYAVDDYGDQERWGLKVSVEGGDWTPR